jgi:spore germination protein
LTVYTYFYTDQGEIFNINDEEIIKVAKTYGVAPIMMLAAYSSNQAEEIETTDSIIINKDIQDRLINNLVELLKDKGYYGVNFKTPYIKPESRPLYVEFVNNLSSRLKSAGFVIFISLTMSVFEHLSNIKYEGLQYNILGQAADKLVLITYEFGFAFGISPAVLAYEIMNNILDYATNLVPSQKFVSGLSTIGYMWKLPYAAEVIRGQSMSYDSVIALAKEVGAEILYDEVTKASYFQYIFEHEYIVRFRDARGVEAVLGLVPAHNLNGTAIWNCMFFYHQMWLIANSQYEIEKIIPLGTLDCKDCFFQSETNQIQNHCLVRR